MRAIPLRISRPRELPRLDRLVRGRAWIPLLGVILVAIVGLRVGVLKLGSSVGRELQQATALESSNQLLRSQVSELSGNQRIEGLAAKLGMEMPGPEDIHFVTAQVGTHVGAAIGNIQTPAAGTFLAGLASERQADGDTAPAASTTSTGTVSSGSTSASTTGATSDSTSTLTGAGATAGAGATSTGTVPTGDTGATSTGTALPADTGASSAATAATTGTAATGATSDTSAASTVVAPASTSTPPAAGTSVAGSTQGTADTVTPSAPGDTGSATGGSGLAG